MLSSELLASSKVNDLFAEVGRLAMQLRTGKINEDNTLPAGGFAVLRVLDNFGPQSVPQIGRFRETSRQNIQILVNSLAAKGWVEFAGNPAHKRSALVSMTNSGKELFAKRLRQEASIMAEIASQISESDMHSATALLRQIRQLLTKGEKPHLGHIQEKASGETEPRRDARRKVPGSSRPKVEPVPEISPDADLDEGELPYNLL